jgi:hypothetical protein
MSLVDSHARAEVPSLTSQGRGFSGSLDSGERTEFNEPQYETELANVQTRISHDELGIAPPPFYQRVCSPVSFSRYLTMALTLA